MQTSLLVAVRGIVTGVTSLVLVPLISFVIVKHLNLHSARKDYRLSQGAGLLEVLGYCIVGLAPTPSLLLTGVVVLALGTVFGSTVRSLAASFVARDQVATLYSAASVVQSLGVLLGGPLLAYTFRFGMRLGDPWLGLPFALAGFLFLLACIAVSFIRLEPRGRIALLAEEAQEEDY